MCLFIFYTSVMSWRSQRPRARARARARVLVYASQPADPRVRAHPGLQRSALSPFYVYWRTTPMMSTLEQRASGLFFLVARIAQGLFSMMIIMIASAGRLRRAMCIDWPS